MKNGVVVRGGTCRLELLLEDVLVRPGGLDSRVNFCASLGASEGSSQHGSTKWLDGTKSPCWHSVPIGSARDKS